MENSLFFIDKGFALDWEASSDVGLFADRCVFVTHILTDLFEAARPGCYSFVWNDCVMDRGTDGVLLLLDDLTTAGPLGRLGWRETNALHLGAGPWLADRRGVAFESRGEWEDLLQTGANVEMHPSLQWLAETEVRSGPNLMATDVELSRFHEIELEPPPFAAQLVGEGNACERFRKSPGYREWRREFEASSRRWLELNPASGTTSGR
jgi:hypothetical protein